MALDVLLLGVVLAGWWFGRRTTSERVRYILMPTADQPPAASDDPWPPAHRLDRYVDHGLEEIDAYLAGQHPGR